MRYAQYNANSLSNQSLFAKNSIFVYYDYILCLLYYVYKIDYCGKHVEKNKCYQRVRLYIAILFIEHHNI